MNEPMTGLDRQAIRRAFDRAAATYDAHAALQREVADRLLSRLDFMRLTPSFVCDLGAGTGYAARALGRRYRGATTLLADCAPTMLAEARRQRRWLARERYVCADARALPFADASLDCVFSSLAFQWCEELDQVFSECRRVLKPGGLLMFSTLGPDTLKELRAAWARVDEAPHVNRFADMHEVGDGLIRAGFASPVMEREDLVVTYDGLPALLRDLKGIGATNQHQARRRELTTRSSLAALEAAYEPYRKEGRLPATYEVVYAHGWVRPDQRPQDGTTVFPLNRLRRREP